MGDTPVPIHGLCLVKNEADVIAQTLHAASRWCDHIYVFDNGSADGTWEIVQGIARDNPRWCRSRPIPSRSPTPSATRSCATYRSHARAGDWWAILDADEFYIDDPRAFLAQVPGRVRAVWPQIYSYLFTDIDADSWRRDPSRYAPDVPLGERLRHYVLGDYTELRFFRHEPGLTEVPGDLRPIYPERIRLRHYGYRSPDQIRIRLETRREPMLRGEFIHEKRSNWFPGGSAAPGPALPEDLPRGWQERIVPHGECLVELRGRQPAAATALGPARGRPCTTSRIPRLEGGLRGAIGRMLHLA